MSEDRELEEIRRKREAEIQSQAEQQQEAAAKKAEVDAQKAMILRQILTPQARDRLANIKMARPDFAESIENQLITIASRGNLPGPITEEQLVDILKKLQSSKRESTIEFKRK
jgi:programmed cell death protein 5